MADEGGRKELPSGADAPQFPDVLGQGDLGEALWVATWCLDQLRIAHWALTDYRRGRTDDYEKRPVGGKEFVTSMACVLEWGWPAAPEVLGAVEWSLAAVRLAPVRVGRRVFSSYGQAVGLLLDSVFSLKHFFPELSAVVGFVREVVEDNGGLSHPAYELKPPPSNPDAFAAAIRQVNVEGVATMVEDYVGELDVWLCESELEIEFARAAALRASLPPFASPSGERGTSGSTRGRRDRLIYELCCDTNIPLKEIRSRVQTAFPNETAITTDSGIRQAAIRHARRDRKPPPPSRYDVE